MQLMEAIYARRSVRAFTGDSVSRETLEKLIAVAVQAPNGMNLQPWAFGVIEGMERLKAYSDRTKALLLENLEQFTWLERYREMFANPNSNIFHGASAVIIVFAKPNGATPDMDCTMAAQNIMLAACDMGLGSCWIGFFTFLLNLPEFKQELGIPEELRAVAPIAIGYPQKELPPSQRAAPEVIFWQE